MRRRRRENKRRVRLLETITLRNSRIQKRKKKITLFVSLMHLLLQLLLRMSIATLRFTFMITKQVTFMFIMR